MSAAPPLILVVVNASRTNPGPATTALVYAQTGRALDQAVEIHLTGESVTLAFEGVAAQIVTDPQTQTRLIDHIQRAHEMDVKIYACSMALRTHHLGEPLIAQLSGQAGTTAVIGRMLVEHARVLTF